MTNKINTIETEQEMDAERALAKQKTISGRRNFLIQMGAATIGVGLTSRLSAHADVGAQAAGLSARTMGTNRSGALKSSGLLAGDSLSCRDGKTPTQPEGPFYPIQDQLDKDNDLTRVEGRAERALGQIIYVRGRVLDINCQPIKGALVEIWQACESGKYDHPGDPNPAPLDQNFQYWGQNVTQADGTYVFKTILPGAYPASADWMRPPHIHFKISHLGSLDLITQLYFAGDVLNDRDLILQRLPLRERQKVIAPLLPATQDFEPDSKIANFDIVLESVR